MEQQLSSIAAIYHNDIDVSNAAGTMGPREHNSTLPRIWWESEQDWEDRWEADLLRPDFFAPARPPVRGFVPVPPPRRNRGANRERVIWVVDDGRWTIRAVDSSNPWMIQNACSMAR